MNDGRIMAADFQFYTNAGCFVDESVLVSEKILLHFDNAYNIPNLRGCSAICRTNLPSNTAFRGFGVPQGLLVVENMINDVAMVLGRPADQIRETNMYRGPSVTPYKLEFSAENLLRCWEECKLKSEFSVRLRAVEQFNQQNRWKKRGISIIPVKYGIAFSGGFLNQAAALVHVYKDGSVLVSHGGTEMGQGIHTKMQQVASRELHIPTTKIYISETSTGAVPNTCPSAASFGTDANGMAVKNACQVLYQRLEPIRLKNPKGSWESWVEEAFLDKISLSATGFFRGPDLYMDWDKMEGQPYSYFTYGVCCSEVELDCLTGDYRAVRTDIVVDIGRSLNPSVDIGQVEGAFMQGLGLYTLEELKFSPSGFLYTRGPSQYKIPAVCDVPLRFNVYLLSDSNNPHAIYSSKGIGEPTLFLGSSVFFAIKDAVAAARSGSGLVGPFPLDSPATPERACLACASPFVQKVPASKSGSFKPWALNI
ncbi:xanthine dehydrogenase/oxidase-like isoform X1 [Kryptolebias marmoratus]|uniref:xanthine dehydrogenase/oxidase-like isoform X1 n=1 Tax=Kryptolebias marmoratus TaxID=37003 RepID=UPI0007F93511|nr:xanthine dehydrogenase/oxidase-like isoform X1 [Kryptolebias marmoratus]